MNNNYIKNIMMNQPIINLGCLGSVSDGKSTMVEKCSGTKTQRHSNEKVRNITIKQGYGNMKIWEKNGDYHTTNSSILNNDDMNLVNHISFVDCPGHQEYINTMLSSISVMDGAIFVIAVDQPLKNKPQLIQHLAAAKLGKINKIIICMNKIDLVSKDVVRQRKYELDELLTEYDIKPYIIIPTSFNKRIGINYLIQAIMELFSNYHEKINDNTMFRISRTFDINKPGTNWREVNGGVIGGSLISGKVKVGDEIEILPGYLSKDKNGKFTCNTITTKILSIKSDNNELDEIIPGGLVGIRTDLDPFYCKNDTLAGNAAIIKNTNQKPKIYNQVYLDTNYINTFGFNWEPKIHDLVSIQMGTRVIDAKVTDINRNTLLFDFVKPVCISDNEHIIICKVIDRILRIVADSYLKYSENQMNTLL
jgi:translation initiation factor 2 subunit 3